MQSLGVIDASTVAKVIKEVTEEEKARQAAWEARPPLENILNMHDFEVVAKAVIPEKAWVGQTSLWINPWILSNPLIGILLLGLRR